MTFEMAKTEKNNWQTLVDQTSKILNSFPKNEIGLVPDEVKNSPEFKSAKIDYWVAFYKLRQFNLYYIKNFKTQINQERKNKFNNVK